MLNLNNYANSTMYNKFYHKNQKIYGFKTLLEREALVMFFLTQKRLKNAGNMNFSEI